MPVYVCISFVTYEHPLYRFIVLHRGLFVYCPFLLDLFNLSPEAFSVCKEISMERIDKTDIFILDGLILYRKECNGL